MQFTKKQIKRFVFNTLLIMSGSMICGLAYSLFIIPHHFVPGGVSGIAIILNYFFMIPVGAQIIILNIPILFLGWRIMGKKYTLSSIIGMCSSSLTIDFCTEILKLGSATGNRLLAAIYGGIMLGVGLGLIFRGRSSTGGSDIIGQILNRYTGMSIGFGIMIVDFFVISASGLAFRNIEAPLYGYIVLFISSRVIDMILEGWNYSKLVFITSTKTAEIERFILDSLDRSGTALKSRSLYMNRDGELIFTVIHRKQLSELQGFIKEIDPEAFVIISDTHTVLGKGFKAHDSE